MKTLAHTLALAALLATTPAWALTFSGSTAGTFGSPSGSIDAVGSGTSSLTLVDTGNGSDDINVDAATLSFAGTSFSTSENQNVNIGALTFTGLDTSGLNGVLNVPLDITATMTAPAGLAPQMITANLLYNPQTGTIFINNSTAADIDLGNGATGQLTLLGFEGPNNTGIGAVLDVSDDTSPVTANLFARFTLDENGNGNGNGGDGDGGGAGAIPEPASIALLPLALVALAVRRRRA